jgi:hypothetical protein
VSLDPILLIAALQSHGYSGDSVSPPELEAQLARGERIVVSCGTVARLGIRAARRAGFDARLVATLTLGPYDDGFDDGHTMFEIKMPKGWTLWDLDTNAKAPEGVGVNEAVAGPIKWQTIGTDPVVAEGEWPADLNAWRRRVFGVPLIFDEPQGVWYFRGRQRERVLEYGAGSYRWASKWRWWRLTR